MPSVGLSTRDTGVRTDPEVGTVTPRSRPHSHRVRAPVPHGRIQVLVTAPTPGVPCRTPPLWSSVQPLACLLSLHGGRGVEEDPTTHTLAHRHTRTTHRGGVRAGAGDGRAPGCVAAPTPPAAAPVGTPLPPLTHNHDHTHNHAHDHTHDHDYLEAGVVSGARVPPRSGEPRDVVFGAQVENGLVEH